MASTKIHPSGGGTVRHSTTAPQLPAGVQPCDEIEHVLVEEGIPHFDRGMHRYAISLRLQEVPRQRDARGDPDAAVQRVPVPGALERGAPELGQAFGLARAITSRIGSP